MAPVNSDNWLEIKHEILACEWAHDHGWLTPKLQHIGSTGWPDRCFIRRGRVVFIEFKRPRGGHRTPKQIWWLKQINEHGAEGYFCRTATEAIEILTRYD